MAKRTRKSILISIIILLILVVVFPLISLKYLNKGLDFRKDQLATLEHIAPVANFFATNKDGKTLSKELVQGKITVISHEEMACDAQYANTLSEYVSKFQNQDVFRHVIINDKMSCSTWDQSYLTDDDQSDDLSKQFNRYVKNAQRKTSVMLADRQGELRRTYDLTKREDIEALVTHTTLLLPPLKKRK